MVVGMQNSSCSSASSNSIGTCSEMKVKCHYKIYSMLRIVKRDSNYRKKFYEYYLWPISTQNFIFFLIGIIS